MKFSLCSLSYFGFVACRHFCSMATKYNSLFDYSCTGTGASILELSLELLKQTWRLNTNPIAVRGYHVYKNVWKPSLGDKLACEREFSKCFDKCVMKVVNNSKTVGHLPCKFGKKAWYFLAHGGTMSVKVTSNWRRCKQPCGGIEFTDHTLCKKGDSWSLKNLLKKI